MFKLTLLACLLAPLICGAKAAEFQTSEKGNVFFVERELEVSWYDALRNCSLRNMTLLTPDTEKKQLEISKLMSSLELRHLWTAGQQIQHVEFMWITTGDIVTYSNWAEDAQIRVGSSSYPQCIGLRENQWASYNCSDLKHFLCEENPIEKVKKLVLDALKAIQSVTNNQLEDLKPPLSNGS